MVEDYGIQLPQMMENAGRILANLARDRFLDGSAVGRDVVVLAGHGGNGGGGLVCARWLHNRGARVKVWLAAPIARFAGTPRLQLDIVQRMDIPVVEPDRESTLPHAALLVDALVGYSLMGAPSGSVATLIKAANDHEAEVLALDVPSGVDTDTGEVYNPAIRASATLTLALPKRGLHAANAREHVGELYLADIGVPPSLYAGAGLGLDVGHIFAKSDLVRLR